MKKRLTFKTMSLMAITPALLCLSAQATATHFDKESISEKDGIHQEIPELIVIGKRPAAQEEEKEKEEKIEVVENEAQEEEIEVVADEAQEEEIEVVADEAQEEEIEVVADETQTEELEEISSLRSDKDGLETVVCQQRSKISELEKEIAKIKESSTAYMPMMNSMNQLMMMNMVMSQQQQQQRYSYQPNTIDIMSQMLAPTMLMQSMSMGMNIRSMNDLYHNYRQPAPQGPQYNYNVGGDFYGRDYSMTQAPQQPQQGQQPQLLPARNESQAMHNAPYGFDFGERNANFGNIEPVGISNSPSAITQERTPSQDSATENALSADDEMI